MKIEVLSADHQNKADIVSSGLRVADTATASTRLQT